MSAANPFGAHAMPRNLDNEQLYGSWFRIADAGKQLCPRSSLRELEMPTKSACALSHFTSKMCGHAASCHP